MTESVRDHLLALVAQDPSVGDDARRCEALLRDMCKNQHKKEIAALVAAVRERIVAEIRSGGTGVPPHAFRTRLVQRLHDDCGLREDLCQWAIESWASAYRASAVKASATPAAQKDRIAPTVSVRRPPSVRRGPVKPWVLDLETGMLTHRASGRHFRVGDYERVGGEVPGYATRDPQHPWAGDFEIDLEGDASPIL